MEQQTDLTLWYRQPANEWVEALPVGNGRLGAMVFGGIEQERIQINEETVWDGKKTDRNNPQALDALSTVRQLLFDGQNEAAALLQSLDQFGSNLSERTRDQNARTHIVCSTTDAT